MSPQQIDSILEAILHQYGGSFAKKIFGGEPQDVDDLMLIFGLTQAMKVQNKQYWGRVYPQTHTVT